MIHRLALALCVLISSSAISAPLAVEDVLGSVRSHYPPLLASWLQKDIANGRIRRAQGAFDPLLSTTVALRPGSFYDGTNAEFLVEQPFTGWGGSLYGGYRISSGSLPDYENNRTADGGGAVLGVRVPFLRDGDFDERRAALGAAAIERELANPFILRQYLDFHRAARISYFSWLAAGKRLAVAQEILRVAQTRDDFLKEKSDGGAIAPILLVDNHRLVVSREIAVIEAQRRVEATAIELSLFHRDLGSGDPIVPQLTELPESFPKPTALDPLQLASDRGRAEFRRPEIREIDLLINKGAIDQRLARNQLKPNLDLAMEFNQAIGQNRPKDINENEFSSFLRFSVPIGRNEAKGRMETIQAQIARLEQEKQFARENIIADVNDAYSAVDAAYTALKRTSLNVHLAEELEAAEAERFKQGASDLLALQIREQSTFEARILEIDATFAYFKALADYQAAVAMDAPSSLWTDGQSAPGDSPAAVKIIQPKNKAK